MGDARSKSGRGACSLDEGVALGFPCSADPFMIGKLRQSHPVGQVLIVGRQSKQHRLLSHGVYREAFVEGAWHETVLVDYRRVASPGTKRIKGIDRFEFAQGDLESGMALAHA